MQKKYKITIFIFLCGLAPYWLMNAVIWIPWVFLSRTIGIILMVIFVPVFWGYFSYYCLRHIERNHILKVKWIVSIIFLFDAFISDIFFFLIWRKMSLEELYHWSSIASYLLVFIIPIILALILERKKIEKPAMAISRKSFIFISIFIIVFLIITLYCVRYW